MAKKWKSRRDVRDQVSLGHAAYAEKQMAMWNELGRVAQLLFIKGNPTHLPVWEDVV